MRLFRAKPAAAVNVPDPDAVDAVIDGFVDDGYYPFIYARLEDRDGDVVYEHSAVNRELLPDAEIDGQTWIRIWSMSKIVTISTVLDLVEDGVLSLEDPVTDYIPEFENMQVAVTADGAGISARWNGSMREAACPFERVPMDTVMTVRHLINHEAGFYYATTNFPCLDAPLNEQNVAVAAEYPGLHRSASGAAACSAAGREVTYYGTNTTVLGMVAERAANKSLKQLVEERLTGPLGIARTPVRPPGGCGTLAEKSAAGITNCGSRIPGSWISSARTYRVMTRNIHSTLAARACWRRPTDTPIFCACC